MKCRGFKSRERVAVGTATAEGEHVLPGGLDDGGKANRVEFRRVGVAADALQRAGE